MQRDFALAPSQGDVARVARCGPPRPPLQVPRAQARSLPVVRGHPRGCVLAFMAARLVARGHHSQEGHPGFELGARQALPALPEDGPPVGQTFQESSQYFFEKAQQKIQSFSTDRKVRICFVVRIRYRNRNIESNLVLV